MRFTLMVKAKKAGEELFFDYAKSWSKGAGLSFPEPLRQMVPSNYNSAVATFCNNMASFDLPIQSQLDPSVELELLYRRPC